MSEIGLIKWLKDNNICHIAENNYASFTKIFTDCLKLKKEHVLIVYDTGYEKRRCAPILAGCYLMAAKRLGLSYKAIMQQPKPAGHAAESHVAASLFQLPPKNAVVLCLSGKLGSMGRIGKSFRAFVSTNSHRFLSTSGLQDLETKYYKELISSIGVDYKKLQQKAVALKKMMDYAGEIRIVTDKGTNLYASIKGKMALKNDGDYALKGGNMPAGEVYIAPRGNKVEGKVVIDGTVRHMWGTAVVKDPVTLIIEKGEVVSIEGSEEARLLEKTFEEVENRSKHPWGVRRLGEIGIGISDTASIIPVTIVSEKTLGTAHVGIGSNAWFGGTVYSVTHFDQVFRNPKIYLGGKKIDLNSI